MPPPEVVAELPVTATSVRLTLAVLVFAWVTQYRRSPVRPLPVPASAVLLTVYVLGVSRSSSQSSRRAGRRARGARTGAGRGFRQRAKRRRMEAFMSATTGLGQEK